MGRKINLSGTEFGARIPVTILDRGVFSPRYETENINAWLRHKGLQAKTAEGQQQDWDWERNGFGLGKITSKETEALVSSDQITPGAAVEIFDHLKLTLAEMTSRTTDRRAQQVLTTAGAVCFVLAEEIRACARGETLPSDFYLTALEKPLAGVGIVLEESKK
jgi:hypothetical protein